MGNDTETHGEGGDKAPLTDSDADELIDRYQDLVYKIAHRLHDNLPDEVPIDDLIGWGYTGLLEARERYDESRQTRFATYAYYRIRGAMLDSCPEPLLDPKRQQVEAKCNEVLNTYAHVVQNQEGQASLEDRLSMLSDVSGSLMMVFVLSDCPARALRPDGAPQNRDLVRRQSARKVREALEHLSDNEQRVLEGIYFEDETMTDLADELDLSPSWVSRLHTRALERMRGIIDDNEEFDDLRHAIPV